MTSQKYLAPIAAGAMLSAATLFLPATTTAQFTPAEESLSGLYPGKAYSPYAQRSFPSQVFWGDTHLHTGLSMDAGPLRRPARPG